MATIGQICQYLFRESVAPESVALANYLQNYAASSEPFTESVLTQFFRRALSFPHWREHRESLHTGLTRNFEMMARQLQDEFDPTELLTHSRLQPIEIERTADLKEILARHIENQIEKTDKYRLLSLPDQRVLSVVLLSSGVLRVSLFTHWATMIQGKIVPLVDDMHLVYSPNLEIAAQHVHHTELSAHLFARFKVTDNGYTGYLIRGYKFQRLEPMNGGPLNSYPALYYPLKRLEQFFINRDSDPLYREVTLALEKAAALCREGDPESARIARSALHEARTAYERIFAEDRLLGLLIRDLTRMLPQSDDLSLMPRPPEV